MIYLLSFSPIDLCKSFSSFSFGFGAAVGIGYIFRKVKKEQEKRQEHLLSCLRQLSAEVGTCFFFTLEVMIRSWN